MKRERFSRALGLFAALTLLAGCANAGEQPQEPVTETPSPTLTAAPEPSPTPAPTEEELRAWWEEHKDNYRTAGAPPRPLTNLPLPPLMDSMDSKPNRAPCLPAASQLGEP